MHPLESYLEELAALRSSRAVVKETSGYPALANLFNAVGHSLKPKVRCFIHPKNSGAGMPDGGLFTPDQLKNTDEEKPLLGVLQPSRGVIEVKSANEELADIAQTKQVKAYLVHYGQVLLTNYRDFLLLKRGPGGATQKLESFRLADSEAAFWIAATHPRKTAGEYGERMLEYAGISPEEEQGLVEPYKVGLITEWGIKKFNLDELYVRFFRLAERRIAEKTGKGIVCYISNFSYLGDPSFVVMRQRFLQEFDALWFDCLNGDSRETGKLTPEGKPDPSVFSTEYNREGIRVGTAVGLMVRQPKRAKKPQVFFRQFWGASKRAEIVESLTVKNFAKQYKKVATGKDNRFAFLPSKVATAYLQWPRIPDFAAIPSFNGPVERRAMALISIAKKPLVSRMVAYFDESITDAEVAQIYPSLMMTGNRIVGPEARKKVCSEFSFDESRVVRYPFKPFDVRWCYLENLRPLFSEPSPQLLEQRFKGNSFFITRDGADKDIEGSPFYCSPLVCDYDCISGHARHFPIRLRAAPKTKPKQKDDGNGEFGSVLREAASAYHAGKIAANLSPAARAYLTTLGIKNPDADADTAALLWMHALAIGFSPAYLAENADGIRQDWPRIPLPESRATLLASAELGKQVAALLDTETPVAGVDAGKIRPELVKIAVVTRLTKETLNLSLTAGWGHAGKGGVTMPGKGKLETRGYAADEAASPLLGQSTHDVFLNDTACWRNVPEKVWDYTIGGYQVIKKWLSYREDDLLGRVLTPDEAREVTHTARRIAALILLQPELDANYQRVKAAPLGWKP